MRVEHLDVATKARGSVPISLTWVHTLVVGSGASGLNAAVQLRANGIEDVLIVTEGLQMGTSINAGSDKQTYYKLSMGGDNGDSPIAMAEDYFSGGSMHGDLALVEASVSARAFINLVNLGVPFPTDRYGQFIGYKTDHDPRQRATSVGPYTSREMCRALIRHVGRVGIPVREGRNVVQLLTMSDGNHLRVAGAVVVGDDSAIEVYGAENVVFAVGGPGGLYRTSVYPEVHAGAIGLALVAGAAAQSLPESQFGLASIKFRWNVSGTYMQVIPRFISTAADGVTDEREFLRDAFESMGEMNSRVFLKGYQWPFDSRKVSGGSSIVDILVYIETVEKGRRVFLDFRRDPGGFRLDDLCPEALDYLSQSGALQASPVERLRAMNPSALALYDDNGIDLTKEPLEVAVCAQHNNGGLAGNHWWESINVGHLFPVGEVNGSHGVYRPGGSALNSGQVGAFRAAEYIGNRYGSWSVPEVALKEAAASSVCDLLTWIDRCASSQYPWQAERKEIQTRMSRVAAHIRSARELRQAVSESWQQWRRIEKCGSAYGESKELSEALRNRHLCFAHAVYLEATLFALESGVGSRGSAIVLDPDGVAIHAKLGQQWRVAPENVEYRSKVQETVAHRGGTVENRWVDRRPIPETDTWFETAWARFRSGQVFD